MSRNSGSLGERFSENYAWHQRVAGKMAGEHRVAFRKYGLAFSGQPRVSREQFLNEYERRPMWQAKEVTSDV